MQPRLHTPHDGGESDPARIDLGRFRGLLKSRVGTSDFEHWFRDRTSFRLDGEEVVVGVASPFLLNWMQSNFRSAANDVARELFGPSVRSRFEVDPTLHVAPPKPETTPLRRRKRQRTDAPARKRPGRRFRDLTDLVEGDCNRLALTAAKRVCTDPRNGCNPLLLFGGVGTGKSHVLEGIHRRLRRDHGSLDVSYVTGESFGNYFVEALKNHTLPGFRKRFRSVDVLLVDDVDFFDGKKVIQEEFLNTVKHFESTGTQLVVSAARHPRLMAKVGDELSTRLVSGIACRMESPDPETARRIVEHKSLRMKLNVSPEVLDHVARRFRGSVREIEGALGCLETWCEMTKRRVALGDARRLLTELERDCVRVVRMSDVEKVVCRFFGVEADELKSARRHRVVSQPRMLAMFLARKLIGASYSEIGRHFRRNHTTVLNAERTVNGWVADQETVVVSAQQWTMQDVLVTLERELAG